MIVVPYAEFNKVVPRHLQEHTTELRDPVTGRSCLWNYVAEVQSEYRYASNPRG